MFESLFRNIPPVVKNLLIINVLFYLATVLLEQQGINITGYLGLHYIESNQFYPHQLITYMFMHGSVMHIFFNMFAVWMFGRVLEQVWGPKRFLIYYMATGIGAGIIQILVAYIRLISVRDLLSPEEFDYIINNGYEILQNRQNFTDPIAAQANILINIGTVGASGAVFGILLAFGMLFPNTELMLLFPPIPIKAKWFVIFYGIFELYAGFANNPNDNVAHFAHLGGMLFGFVLIKYWKADRNKFY
ncbi:MAG: rhomboid family intramembrane serine protease [Flavobacteriales bacterium]|nr:rhomboid family intramembrane serine protease [Flavobacteriales bacterium]MCW8914029.1 rhomboid family intramembrane serine protease [Flavobacteriales bacterium]MCW8938087.1 rhomboid family intramembrane serine protease [Flavobacteriales bacterium]MCW8969395.1 rhomboid family intramembrane serine protease [Flavobacteriales bacterium]MCW8991120.1 rhomboid family intramembrane serine protease [Flavobacteriales bacterium]